MRLLGRRGWPGGERTVSGDQTDRVHERGGAWARRDVRWVAPLRLEAAWYAPAPARPPGTTGRPRVKGARVPQLKQVLKEAPPRQRVRGRWSNSRRREREVTSGTAVGDRIGPPVLPLRWVLGRAPTGRLDPGASLSTCPQERPPLIVQPCLHRGTIAPTSQESRTHLGLETPRHWADRAIERPTPCLLGRSSLAALLANARPPEGKVPVQQTA